MKTVSKKLLITIIALIAIIASIVLGIMSGCNKGSNMVYSYDYFSEDLSKYIEIVG